MCLQMLSLSRFHTETGDALCSAPRCAVPAAGRPGLERSSCGPGQGQAELRGEQGAAPRAEEPLPGHGCREPGAHSWGRAETRAPVLAENRAAGCSTWLFKLDLITLRSFFHLMLCKNWFYLPLMVFFSPPSLSSCG